MLTRLLSRLFDKQHAARWFMPILVMLLLATLTQPHSFVFGQAATPTPPPEEEPPPNLSTAFAVASLVQPGRAVVTARTNWWVVDSVPPLGGPNEAMNPLDSLFGALATCGMFIYETGAKELGFPLTSLNVTAEGDLAPAGVRDGSVDPRIRAFRVLIEAKGIDADQAAELKARFETRCPIYTTLIRSAPIEVIHVGLEPETARILEIDFAYTGTPEEYTAAVSPLAAEFAKVRGLRWKIWGLDEESGRAGGTLFFDTERAMNAFIASELAAKVVGNPAFSDVRVAPYGVMVDETGVTHGPISLASIAALQPTDTPGVLLEVNFTYNVTPEEYAEAVAPLAEEFAAIEGLRWKIWANDEANSQFSGLLLFDDAEAAQAFGESELAATLMNHPALSDFSVTPYAVMGAESAITHAPLGTMGE
jgi:putative redox protein